jgi:hypothetical protein
MVYFHHIVPFKVAEVITVSKYRRLMLILASEISLYDQCQQ